MYFGIMEFYRLCMYLTHYRATENGTQCQTLQIYHEAEISYSQIHCYLRAM